MIAFTKWFLRLERKPIPLSRPKDFVLIRGADQERIYALFDEHNRMRKLIVHTRAGAPPKRKQGGFRVFRRN